MLNSSIILCVSFHIFLYRLITCSIGNDIVLIITPDHRCHYSHNVHTQCLFYIIISLPCFVRSRYDLISTISIWNLFILRSNECLTHYRSTMCEFYIG